MTPLSGPCPKPAPRRPGPPKIIDFSSKLNTKSLKTHTSEFSVCSWRNICGGFGTPRWRQVPHSTFFSFGCELTERITHVRVLTGNDSHALYTPSLVRIFCTLLGADGTSLDVLRKQLGIPSSPASPQPLPLQPSSLSYSHTPTLGWGTTLRHWTFTFYTLVRATHLPSRSSPHKPSLAKERSIASIYQVVRYLAVFACMHLRMFFCYFLSFCWFFQ